ncbi:MAG: glycoside hydrolase family 28 protein [Bacteroidales bacterium]|nr:glycoside hydrolase family 28 protein [Bacteroidales bacterium]
MKTKKAGLFAALLLLCLTLGAQEKPNIPSTSVSLADFGAVADGVTLNTKAFEKAISALSKKGGGHLIVPEGLYLTGPISLKDCMDLHLERGAILLLSPDKKDAWDGKSVKAGISASKRHDVAITGEGIIDGNGAWWRAVKRSKVSDVEWKEFLKKGGTVDGSLWYPFNLNHYENIAADARSQEKLRTHLVRFTSCERVLVSGVTLQNSPKFHLVPRFCKDVTIEGVTVRCPWNAQNGDGIDIMQCQDVLVSRCTVDVGDDGICLKSGAGAKALEEGGPCKNIVIEYNTVYHAHGGFVIGSEFSAGCEDIVVRHNSFLGTDTGLRFKSAPERGGRTKNIRISDIYMADITEEAIVFQTDYADRPAGYEDNEAAKTLNFIPDFQDIEMERVVCRGCSVGVKAQGREIRNILLKDSHFFWYDAATDIQKADMITLENVQFHSFE